MSKATLIIDTPNNCYECPCFMDEGWRCQNRLDIDEEVHDGRPSWCPLIEKRMKYATEFGYSDDLFKVKGYDGNYYPLICGWTIKEDEQTDDDVDPIVTITLETFGFVLEKTLRGEMAGRKEE